MSHETRIHPRSPACRCFSPAIPCTCRWCSISDNEQHGKRTTEMGTAAARNGVSSRDSFDSIQSADSPPLYQPASASSSGSADSAPDASKCTVPECSACAETGSQPCVEGMRRVLGDVHIRGVSAGKLHPGKTQRQEAPFANCTVVLDRPLSVVVIGSGFGEHFSWSIVSLDIIVRRNLKLTLQPLPQCQAGFSAAIACTRQGKWASMSLN